MWSRGRTLAQFGTSSSGSAGTNELQGTPEAAPNAGRADIGYRDQRVSSRCMATVDGPPN